MKKMFMNEKGMTLVEIMIATAIMGAMALGFTQMMQNQTKSMNYMDARNSEAELSRQIELLIGHPDSCRITFAAFNVITAGDNPIAITDLLDKNGDPVLSAGDKFGVSKEDLEIVSMTAVNPGQPGPPFNVPANTTSGDFQSGYLELEIRAQRIRKILGASDVLIRKKLAVTTDDNNEVVDCSVFSAEQIASDAFCIDGDCKTVNTTQSCPAGQMIVRITNGGTIECASSVCTGANEVLKGFDLNGAVCVVP